MNQQSFDRNYEIKLIQHFGEKTEEDSPINEESMNELAMSQTRNEEFNDSNDDSIDEVSFKIIFINSFISNYFLNLKDSK